MKKLLTLVCMAAIATSVFAAGNLKADDCDLGTVTSKKEVKSGFTFVPEKGIVVEDKSKEPVKNGDVAYKKRIKTKGITDAIQFSAKKGEVVTIVGTSASKESSRQLSLRSTDGKKIASLEAPAWNADSPKFTTGTIEIPADGDYIIRSNAGGGLYIFEIDIK